MHRNEILFNWTNLYGRLTDEDLAEWWNSLDGPTASRVTELQEAGQVEARWLAAKDLCHQQSIAQAKGLGYACSQEGLLTFHSSTLVGVAVGYDAGQELINRWQFKPKAREPNSMWDIMDFRVDGEAVIGLIGDDRGYDKDWVYMVIVAWYPKEVHGKCSPETALI